MNENLILANQGRPFLALCLKCGKHMWAGDVEDGETVYADLTGPAYKAYYCNPCAQQRNQEMTKP